MALANRVSSSQCASRCYVKGYAPFRPAPGGSRQGVACSALSRQGDISQGARQALVAGLSACLLLGTAPAAPAETIAGPARVVDGDTLVINGERIRLYGVDAPESAQQCKDAAGKEYACGLVSKDALAKKIGSSPVKCEVKNKDQYGRNVSVCGLTSPAGFEDLNAWLVNNGYAVAYRQYGKDYVALEDAAHAANKGVWQGEFQIPSDWRKANKRSEAGPVQGSVAFKPSAEAPVVPTCPNGAGAIKGNINSSGEKIYHVPGGRYYESVRIDLPDGEKYFCSEAEAVAAGWRKSAQ